MIPFLDDDSWDREGFAQQNKEYLDVDVPIQMPSYLGFFNGRFPF